MRVVRGRRLSVVLLLLLLCIVAAYAWHRHSENAHTPHSRDRAPVIASPAIRRDVPIWLDAVGTVAGDMTIVVQPQVTGILLAEPFTEGAYVKKGDVLAEIDPRSYRAALDQALATLAKDEALLENDRRDLERYINLGNAVSAQTLDTQRSLVKQQAGQVDQDRAAAAAARINLSYCTITAPISGIIGIRQVDPGNLIQPSSTTGIATLTTLEPVDVLFSLPQQDITEVNAQMQAQKTPLLVVAYDSDGTTELGRGRLLALDSEIDTTTGSIRLKAIMPNKSHSLWPSGFVNARLLLMTKKNALTIPTVAIQRGPNGPYVFLLDPATNKVSLRLVNLGETADLDTIVTGGLQPGDQVIVEGMAKLEDGMTVKVAGPDGTVPPSSGKEDDKQGNEEEAPPRGRGENGSHSGHHHHAHSANPDGSSMPASGPDGQAAPAVPNSAGPAGGASLPVPDSISPAVAPSAAPPQDKNPGAEENQNQLSPSGKNIGPADNGPGSASNPLPNSSEGSNDSNRNAPANKNSDSPDVLNPTAPGGKITAPVSGRD